MDFAHRLTLAMLTGHAAICRVEVDDLWLLSRQRKTWDLEGPMSCAILQVAWDGTTTMIIHSWAIQLLAVNSIFMSSDESI